MLNIDLRGHLASSGQTYLHSRSTAQSRPLKWLVNVLQRHGHKQACQKNVTMVTIRTSTISTSAFSRHGNGGVNHCGADANGQLSIMQMGVK